MGCQELLPWDDEVTLKNLQDWSKMLKNGLLIRERHCRLDLDCSDVSKLALARYLSTVDRVISAMLARDRLDSLGDGRFSYNSNSFNVLGFEIRAVVKLSANWKGQCLQICCEGCGVDGPIGLNRELDFQLEAEIRPGPFLLIADVWVGIPWQQDRWLGSRSIVQRVLDLVLDRIERRFRRGLRKDVMAWISCRANYE
jgi:hypothetical protein